MSVKVDLSNIFPFVTEAELDKVYAELPAVYEGLLQKTCKGSDFLGWLDLPVSYDRDEFARIEAAAAKIKRDSQVLVVVGIGGSYLGARAAIELLRSPNYNLLKKDTPDIYFAGNNLSGDALTELFALIGDRDVSINVISKSGTTTEPAVAFRILKKFMEEKYGKKGAAARIYATTDKARGALKTMADAEGYETFVIPDDVGGRFSVLTPVGLLPMAAAGIDIAAVMAAAAAEREALLKPGKDNAAWMYAAARNALYRKRYGIEILAAYEPSFRFMAEWWKQLYGESEGKDSKGIFPASVDLTADLHSMGQYIQQGERKLLETVVSFDAPRAHVYVEKDGQNLDGLDFLAGMELDHINAMARKGTALAHVDGGVPNIAVTLPKTDEAGFGSLVYFFELACGLSGGLLGVNPCDQPGVEAYKKNMFALLGKPGYEKEKQALEARLSGK